MEPLASTGFRPVSFGEDEVGNLYIINMIEGIISRLDERTFTLYLPLVSNRVE